LIVLQVFFAQLQSFAAPRLLRVSEVVMVAAAGKSLLWVAVLGFIVFYLYALISFAMLRSSFDPENNLYCATLWQCTVTVIRYGLIGDIFDVRSSVSIKLFLAAFVGLLLILFWF